MSLATARLFDRDSFDEELFHDADLKATALCNKEFYRCTFRNVNLSETRWDGTRFEECKFEDCDASRMQPARLSLRGVEFSDCKLMGIDWTQVASNPDVSFTRCNLRYSSFVEIALRKTKFDRCALLEANFIQVDLVEALFEQCEFAGCRFERCDLSRARFPGCVDLLLHPADNRVKGARIPFESAVLLARAFGMHVGDAIAKTAKPGKTDGA
jgi:fluoroquinolone resistance protein